MSGCANAVDDAPITYSQLTEAEEATFAADDGSGRKECDWDKLTTIAEIQQDSRAVLLSSISAEVTADALCIAIRGIDLGGRGFNLFLDTDGNPANGLLSPHHWTDDGSDYLLQDSGGLLPFPETGPAWKPGKAVTTIAPEEEPAASKGTQLRFRIPFSAVNLTAPTQAGFGIGFEVHARADSTLTDHLPYAHFKARIGDKREQTCSVLTGEHASFSPSCSFSGAGRAKIPVRQGVLVPAYFQPSDANWSKLKDGAQLMKGTGKDFWVAVNPNSGPYKDGSTEWTAAKNAWQGVKDNGGAVFGYVHTCASVKVGDAFVCPNKLRGLYAVQEEISRWVCNYPQLDGIWIDEFYPRFEVAEDALDAKPKSPNKEVAPSDPNYHRPGLTVDEFKALEINPDCGYYDRLRRWIKDTYPHLTVIANAGGMLRSNQRRYGRLFDVVVSFEQSQYLAENGALEAQRDTETHANAALIHGGLLSSLTGKNDRMTVEIPKKKRSELIDTAFRRGYSHVYVTDRMYDANPWLDLPVDSLGSSLRAILSEDGKSATLAPDADTDFTEPTGLAKFIANWHP